jgi:hypothetical protein
MKLTLRELRETIHEVLTEINKPPYAGKFFGQVWRTEGPRERVFVRTQDKNTGEYQRFPVYRKVFIDVIWDGHDWLSKQEFDAKYSGRHAQPDPKAGKGPSAAKPGAGGRESVEDFLKRGGKVKKVG